MRRPRTRSCRLQVPVRTLRAHHGAHAESAAKRDRGVPHVESTKGEARSISLASIAALPVSITRLRMTTTRGRSEGDLRVYSHEASLSRDERRARGVEARLKSDRIADAIDLAEAPRAAVDIGNPALEERSASAVSETMRLQRPPRWLAIEGAKRLSSIALTSISSIMALLL